MPSDITDLRERPVEPIPGDRLDSWKEIAAYLKHSERTVRRWQEEGLPVHRHAHKKRAGVYAYKPELDAWWNDGHARLEERERAQAARRPWLLWPAKPRSSGAGALLEQPAIRAHARISWRLIAAFSLAGMAALFLWLNADKLRARIFATPRSIDIHSVAVLPFKNLSKDTEQEYFVDGMTDELITDLAKFGNLRVISHTSVERYKAGKRSLPEIARELGVDAVLEGSVMRSGDHVRVTAQLIRAANDEHIWAQSYDRNLVDALAVQGDIAQDIAKHIRVQATPEGHARKANLPLPSLEAQDAYMRGRYAWNKRTLQGLLQARAFFRQALDREPGYALAWAGLADTEYLLTATMFTAPPGEGMPRAKAAAQHALELDDGLGEAHASLGIVTWAYDRDWPAAEREYKRALELNPSYATAHHFYGIGLASQGRFEEAVAEEKHAVELDPLSPIFTNNLARVLYYARRYEEATAICHKGIEVDPNYYFHHAQLGSIALAEGHNDEALAEMKRASELMPGTSLTLKNLARAYVRSGQRQPALAALQELRQIAKEKYVPAYQFAIVHAELGEADAAFQWLERAIEVERSPGMMFLKVDPEFDVLRGDPRFGDVVKRVGPR